MTEFFLTIVNMSISASWIVLAVLLLRLLLKKAPKWITVLLWGIVAVRLVCPFSIESALSLIPSSQTINPEVALNPPAIDSGVPIIDNVINPIIGEATITFQPEKDLNFFKFIMPYLAGLWLVGITALLIYTVVSYVRVKRKIGTAVLLRENIFQSESVISPFVLGIIKPKIYLPFKMNEQDMEHIIAHEKAHIRRKDHWWKPLGFLILAIHWFNPLMWLGYILLCRDIELACDEKVIKELNVEQKADYSQALLTCSVNRRVIAACPLAFGEVGVKDRVKSVLNYKKPAFWIIVVGIIASVVVAVCFLTNPITNRLGNIEWHKLDSSLHEQTSAMVSNGEEQRYIGAVEDELLKQLFDIRISRQEVSLNRDEDRDKTNTLILNLPEDSKQLVMSSYVGSTYIHFNKDFTEVWVNDNVKPTLSYEVKSPTEAKTIFEQIVGDSSISNVGGVDNPSEIETTIDGYPFFFVEVLEIYDNSILVKATKDTQLVKSGLEYLVSTNVINESIPVADFENGTKIAIIYNGEILETYPAQINSVYAIYNATEQSSAISPTVIFEAGTNNTIIDDPTATVENIEKAGTVTAILKENTWIHKDNKLQNGMFIIPHGKAVTVLETDTENLSAMITYAGYTGWVKSSLLETA